MRGTKAKKIRNQVEGNPLAKRQPMQRVGPALFCTGARRAYRTLKAFVRGGHPSAPLF